jgi:hypothetical protein
MLKRLQFGFKAGLIHLIGSLIIASLCAWLVFGVWYPYPYGVLASGRDLFLIVVAVDVFTGPLLTMVVFNPNKKRKHLWLDMGIVVLVQLSALTYGVFSVYQSRPVFLAFEGHLFRVVSVPDIDFSTINTAPEHLQSMSILGPKLIGTKLISGSESGFTNSIQLAMQGVHPSFRPERWVDYNTQTSKVISEAKPIAQLREKHPDNLELIASRLKKIERDDLNVGYLPLVSFKNTDWVVLVSMDTAEPLAYLSLDGW